MDRKTANREWRDTTRGAPEGVPTGRTVHAFAQRVEALAIASCDKSHRDARHAAAELALATEAEIERLRADLVSMNDVCIQAEANTADRDAEIHRLQDLLRWAYSKLHGRTFSSMDDALKLDELKLLLEHGL